eukprot:TRINITY_DN16694_c0_g1_i1.p1 TRINITY_DN16694_c0_g1~~TRINITY_DN16694_c0_g1_i1.p1  ORF type:complete len:245 (+),score=20.71 TRINITY_DN16694_c0_g1_i1:80-736(+)
MNTAAHRLKSHAFQQAAGSRLRKLVVGTGNHAYPFSRESVGYYMVDNLAARLGLKWEDNRSCLGFVAESDDLVLFKPKTVEPKYNGRAVAVATRYFGIAPESVAVVHHETMHDFGVHLTKFSGSIEDNPAVESIIESLKTDRFQRFSVGVRSNDVEDETIDGGILYHVNPMNGERARLRNRFSRSEVNGLRGVLGNDILNALLGSISSSAGSEALEGL